jgi:CO/xanthine dehydrogenase Mo-binding subunit
MGQGVGASVPRIDTLEKVLGSGKFAADLSLPDLLHGKLQLSDHTHARVLAVDMSEAERLPGARAVHWRANSNISAWQSRQNQNCALRVVWRYPHEDLTSGVRAYNNPRTR